MVKKEVTPTLLATITELSSKGLKQDEIARKIGWHPTTLYNKQKENPEIKEAIELGRLQTTELIASKLIEKALQGDNVCMIFYLKCIAKWNDKAGQENQMAPQGLTFKTITNTKAQKEEKNKVEAEVREIEEVA